MATRFPVPGMLSASQSLFAGAEGWYSPSQSAVLLADCGYAGREWPAEDQRSIVL